ncbi:UDP-glucose dehydrogenase family protein [Paenibacillus arenilitoris]|uniref:UDP-glucose 6-dehydrogenase n=1 Tax=Paenibacillus arenilitoris TaxID=2772299 RepID=A0A927H6M0_9BACL|nr:UDP-glucose/GDP-mannose dehydrogenase family protein [Paenibacillus arenilitoris]MBD2868714.1 UDP-glucose/GDP-mannose dehydrogenase family protein [Paenibacillus arenilitoris]
MNILVIGTGYVGTTTALVFAEMGWNVTGLDTDAQKIQQLEKGVLYFYEPGLEELLRKHLGTGQIRFTTNKDKAIQEHEAIFICVGTPSRPDGGADMRYVKQVAEDIGQTMNGYKLVITKSTVPVGTQEQVTGWIQAVQKGSFPFDVASNPEFLREGKALEDALNPDRVIIGTNSKRAENLLRTLYRSIKCPIVVTAPRTAELIKYASNAFLATKISYMNELARLCDQLGVNIIEVANGIGLDPRIGTSFLQAGIGYGGSCFPKDVSALIFAAKQNHIELSILGKVVNVNQTQPLYLLDKARERLKSFANKKVAVLGLAFKPDTDDMREAPALRIIDRLLSEQAKVYAYDPVAKLPADVQYESVASCMALEDAVQGADAVFLCTEWPVFQKVDWTKMKGIMNRPNLFDGRNLLDSDEMNAIGFFYQGIGYE